MYATIVRFAVIGLLLQIAWAAAAQGVAAAGQRGGGELAALERLLLGAWSGPACGGTYTFKPDGTFNLDHFTPGNNALAGIWSLRWDALPPTLALTFKTSDFQQKNPTRTEYEYLGKTLELKLIELNKNSLVYRYPDHKGETTFERRPEK